MRRKILSIAYFVLSVWVVYLFRVASVMAAPPTEVVMLVCADYGTSSVVFYAASPGAPAQMSNASCAVELASLQAAGFTNVNATLQTYVSATSGEMIGAPGGVNGTYSTYVLTNGILASGNL